MWSREQDQTSPNGHHRYQDHRGLSSSSSKSHSSNSSSSSPFSSSSTLQPRHPRRGGRTMDEVWKDINLVAPTVSRHHHHHPPTATTSHQTSLRDGVVLQDFLPGPFKETATASSPSIQGQQRSRDVALPPPLQAPPPPTVLSLNSGLDFHSHPNCMPNNGANTNSGNSDRYLHHHHHHSQPPPFMTTMPFPDVNGIPAPGIFSFCGNKKRVPELQHHDANGDTGDRRHNRMIKNRESAARSRARKQAYTNELEVENSHLAEENARLRKQYEDLRLALASQLPIKKKLHRTSTAPF